MQEIDDNQIRVIGQSGLSPSKRRKRWIIAIAVAVLLFVALWLVLKQLPRKGCAIPDAQMVEAVDSVNVGVPDSGEKGFTEVFDTSINDVPLTIYLPHNTMPHFEVGMLDTNDVSIVLAVMAADVRSDNGEIVGVSVCKGKVLSRGERKMGFCAIVNGSVSMGVSRETSLFENVVQSGGDFFRQYPLVCNDSVFVPKPKGKAIRQALCDYHGSLVVVRTRQRESYHDFANAIADLGVTTAISLVGGESQLIYADSLGCRTILGNVLPSPNVNYLVWK